MEITRAKIINKQELTKKILGKKLYYENKYKYDIILEEYLN